MDEWLQVGVRGGAIWPTQEIEVQFGGHALLLKPATKDTEQSVHLNLVGITHEEGLTLINRFLSVLSWCDDQALENLFGWSGNPCPVAIPRQPRMIGSSIAFPFFRTLETSAEARLALALYREARSINSVPYAFLGYFKILNVFWKDRWINRSNELVEGIRATLPQIADQSASDRMSKLAPSQADLASYLYESGRCAVAHAHTQPLVDPDSINDIHRLSADMPIIKAIAEYLMEHRLNLSRSIIK